MRKSLLLSFLMPWVLSGQNFQDTLFKKDANKVYCTITFLNDNNVFYTDKNGEGQRMPLNLISFYSQGGRRYIADYRPIDTLATINGELLRLLKTEYIQINGKRKLFSKKLTITIDYGQVDDSFNSKDTKLIDGKNRTITFNSMAAALNFFSLNGYDFVHAYAVTKRHSNYLLRKKYKL